MFTDRLEERLNVTGLSKQPQKKKHPEPFSVPVWFIVCSFLFAAFVEISFSGQSHLASLTTEEKGWLSENLNSIELWYNDDFPPIEFSGEENEFIGVGADVVSLVEKKLGINFLKKQAKDWTGHLAALKSGQCAIAPAIVKTVKRDAFLEFTSAYITIPIVIIGTETLGRGLTLDDLKGLKIAIVRDFATEDFLMEHPQKTLKITRAKNVLDGLTMVAFGQVDAFVGNLAVSSYHISQNGITNLKVVGKTDYSFSLRIGVSKHYPLLFSAIKKAVDSITDQELAEIHHGWIAIHTHRHLSSRVKKTLIMGGLFLGLLILCLSMITVYLKRRLDDRIKRLKLARDETVKSEARFQVLFDLLPFSCVINDFEGRYLLANKYFCKVVEKPLEHIVGRTLEELGRYVDPAGRERVMAELNQKGVIEGAEITVHHNNSKRHILYSSCLIDWNGEKCILSSTVDITPRKQAEEAMMESKERLKLAFNAANDGIWDLNLKSEEVYCSPNYFKMLGFKQGDFPDTLETWKQYLHPDDSKAAQTRFFDYLSGKTDVYESEFRLQTKDGGWKWVLSRGQIVERDETGAPVRVVGTHVDIDEKKLAEKSLMESEENFRVTLHSIGDAVITTDNHGNVSRMNPVAQNLTGWLQEDARGKPLTEVFHVVNSQTEEVVENPVKRVMSTGEVVRVASHSILKSRSRKDYRIADSGAPIRNDNGEIVGVVLVFRDVTGEYAMEERLRQSQKLEAIGVLAGGIAHDFNNILSGLMGFTDLAKLEAGDKEPLKGYLNSITSASFRARDLVRHILTFSRKTDLSVDSICLDTIIKETLNFIRASLPSSIEIHRDLRIKNARIMGDSTQLHQILMNLFTNAGHAMKTKGGRLEVVLRAVHLDGVDNAHYEHMKPGGYFQVIVSDTGSGIPESIKGRIFEPFFTTKAREEGTGMGLSNVYGILKSMGGAISVYSEVGVGSTFKVLIPQSGGSHTEEKSPNTDLVQGEGNILVVDDEEAILEVTQQILSKLGYGVSTELNGHEALRIIKEAPDRFDVILTDMTMPGMTGIELSKEIRMVNPEIPIILCTGFSDGMTKEFYGAAGVTDLVMKPMIAGELSRVVQNAILKKNEGNV